MAYSYFEAPDNSYNCRPTSEVMNIFRVGKIISSAASKSLINIKHCPKPDPKMATEWWVSYTNLRFDF